MIKVHKGAYYIERALIRIQSDGSVVCNVKEYAPTEEESVLMKSSLASVQFPKTIAARNVDSLKPKTRGTLYEFWGPEGIIMVQERRQKSDGSKQYIPWSFLSTGEWEAMEPDGALPLWKPKDRLEPGQRIMIHEGAKAAKFVNDALAGGEWDHPWAEELAGYVHWGMIGGALAPHRADYDELTAMKPTEVVYVCDNDKPGVSALQKVSERWGRSLKGVIFGAAFPHAFDMADPLPKRMFTKKGRYTGPALKSLLQPATWATELVPPPDGKGRPTAVLREDFIEEWLHCITPEVFLHKDWPNKIYSASEFDSKVAPFSNVAKTSERLKAKLSSKSAVLKYVPSEPPGLYGGADGGMYINTFKPSDIKPEPGDAGPWVEFMEHLIVEEEDRTETYRWIATIVAKPEVRPHYGVLLISEQQGVGKGTLGEKILAPLIGEANVSFPSEEEIVDSNFNYWAPHKRLAVVHEIYAGHSSKAYNKLKSVITDRNLNVNQKFQSVYSIENYLMVLACSNSSRALQLARDDRRWFVPKITDKKRSNAYWEALNMWLTQEGGLGIIRWWCDCWLQENAYAAGGSDAPDSSTKRAMIEEGYSPGMKVAQRVLMQMKEQIEAGELPEGTFITDAGLVACIRDELYDGRHNDKLERPATVRSVAQGLGWYCGETRAQIKGWGSEHFGARVIALTPEAAGRTPGDLWAQGLKPYAPAAIL